jgi:hypothetical protein
VENGTDLRAPLAQLEEDVLALSDHVKETVHLHSLAAQKLAAFLVALTAEVMNVTEELIAADIMGASGGARARERLATSSRTRRS